MQKELTKEECQKILNKRYEVREVLVDVQRGKVTILGGNRIPTQEFKFKEDDDWYCVYNNSGHPVMDINIWWDERWGVQLCKLRIIEDDTSDRGYYLSNDGNYFNPEITFLNNDKTPYYDLAWVKFTPGVTPAYAKHRRTLRDLFKGKLGIELRGVMLDDPSEPEGGVNSKPLEHVNTEELDDLIAIGIYATLENGMQQHLIDLDHREIKKLNRLFMGYKYNKG
jgi:hypothetical protein